MAQTIEGQFWLGIIVASAAALFLIADWYFISRHKARRWRAIGLTISAIPAGYIVWLVLQPAPLTFFIASPASDYLAGTQIEGIAWQDAFSELHVTIENKSSIEARDVDVYVATDLLIAKSNVREEINQCTVTAQPPQMPDVVASAQVTRADGTTYTIGPDFTKGVISNFNRIHCATIAPRSHTISTFALIQDKDPHVALPRQAPQWAIVIATYKASNREREARTNICFRGTCYIHPAGVIYAPTR